MHERASRRGALSELVADRAAEPRPDGPVGIVDLVGKLDVPTGPNGLEGRARHALELIEVRVAPAPVGGTGDEPGGAVVGDDQAVVLERTQHDERLAVVAGEAEVGFEAQAQTHRG